MSDQRVTRWRRPSVADDSRSRNNEEEARLNYKYLSLSRAEAVKKWGTQSRAIEWCFSWCTKHFRISSGISSAYNIPYTLRSPPATSATSCAGGRHNMPHLLQVDLWPFDLESGVRVTCDVGSILVFLGLCSRLRRPDVRDRQTSDRQTSDMHHRLMHPTLGVGHNNNSSNCWKDGSNKCINIRVIFSVAKQLSIKGWLHESHWCVKWHLIL